MLARYSVFKKFLLPNPNTLLRPFSSTPIFRRTKTEQSEVQTLEQLTQNLQNKKINSKAFLTKFDSIFQNLLLQSNANKNPSINRLIQNNISHSCFLLSFSLKHFPPQSYIDVFKFIDTRLLECYKEKKAIEDLLRSLTGVLIEADVGASEMDYCLEMIYRILEDMKKQLSVDLYKHLIKAGKYFESFEQDHIETIEAILFSTKHREEFYNANIVDLATLKDFLRIVRRTHTKSPWIEEICKLFKVSITKKPRNSFASDDSFFNYQLNAIWEMIPQNYEDTGALLDAEKVPLSVKMREFSKISRADLQWSRLLDSMDVSIEKAFIDQKSLSLFEFEQIILYTPQFRNIAPKASMQKLLSRITTTIILNHKISEFLQFSYSIYLLILSNTYLKGTNMKNLSITILLKGIISSIDHLTRIVYVLPVLLNHEIVPKGIVELLPTLDVNKKLRLSNDDLMFYIATYISLYSKTNIYNKILLHGLKNIEESFSEFHKQLSFDEKCILIIKMRRYSSHNRNIYLIKPVMESLDMIPQNLFAGVINSAVNSYYFTFNTKNLAYEVNKRLPLMNQRDLALVGKALIWIDYDDSDFWKSFFIRLNELYKPFFLENTTWACDLYQIIYSIELQNPKLYNQILQNCNNMDFKAVKDIYFSRPNLSTTEEITKSEFELEQALNALKITNQRQAILGIHRVDFVVESTVIIELYGRHHFTERNVLNGSSLWRERHLNKLGYKIIGIALQDWNDLGTTDKKIAYLKSKIEANKV